MTRIEDIVRVVEQFMAEAGTPTSEFSAEFVAKMILAMMVSHRKYGLVAKAYPDKFDAMSDIRARASKYRETGNYWFLVDVANFAMIEAMHPKHALAHWGSNDADNSPGRVSQETKQLQQVDNDGGRIGGDTFLHIPQQVVEED